MYEQKVQMSRNQSNELLLFFIFNDEWDAGLGIINSNVNNTTFTFSTHPVHCCMRKILRSLRVTKRMEAPVPHSPATTITWRHYWQVCPSFRL